MPWKQQPPVLTQEAERGVLVFFSYAHGDKWWRDELGKHLSHLKYLGLITTWHDQEIPLGETRVQQIEKNLNEAQIILLLISADFMASAHCYEIEMKRALERYEQKDADVFPILLRAVYYEGALFEKLHMLPANGIPINQWKDQDKAFVEVARTIAKVARKYLPEKSAKPTLLSSMRERTSTFAVALLVRLIKLLGRSVLRSSRVATDRDTYYQDAIAAYQRAITHDPLDGNAYWGMGYAFYAIGRYEKALQAFNQAIDCNPRAAAYAGLGDVLAKLRRYEEAVAACEEAMKLDPMVTCNFADLVQSYQLLGRTEEADMIRMKAKQLGYQDDDL